MLSKHEILDFNNDHLVSPNRYGEKDEGPMTFPWLENCDDVQLDVELHGLSQDSLEDIDTSVGGDNVFKAIKNL